MLTSLIFIAFVLSEIPAGSCTKHACVPNTQFILNAQVCFCDDQGWWNMSNCRTINRRTCTAGQIIWQGCSQCVCQDNGQLLCNNAVCYEDITKRNALISLTAADLESPHAMNSWCTPYKSYFVNCSICVCSASGRTADSHCAKDNSCQQQTLSTTDILTSVNKNICIPKVMYLFSCLHCLCSDGGYFVMDQCVETCRQPQQKEPRRCISRTFYRKNCNVCWCPDNSVADDKYCTKLVCDKVSKFKSLQSLKSVRRKCHVNIFLKPKCFYCTCDKNGNMNENACLESDCLKSDYFKYDVLKTTCGPGEMVPICQECFCLKGGLTNMSYCSNVCSYQSKLNILEKVLRDNQGKRDLIEREKIQRTSESHNCKPNSMYLDQGRYCLCPENGHTNFNLCTSINEDEHFAQLNKGISKFDPNNMLNISCEPNTFVEIDCNTCYCGKNGKIDPKWCTYDDCIAKRMIRYGQTTLRSSNIHNFKTNYTCAPGSIAKVDCNFCICPESGLMKDSACTKNLCSEVEEVYDERFACEPLAYYLVDCNVCLCPRDGVKNVEKCTKKICEKAILRSDTCTPGQFFSNECNVCVCPPNGEKSEGVCTKHQCSDSESPWKKIFRLSQSVLGSKPVQETPKPQQDLDLCFSGEEFEIGCKICVCPDVGLKSYATCSEVMCEENNRLDYWVDFKAKLKKRVAAVRASQTRTGGGPSTEQPLSEIETKFLSILGENFGQGLPGVRVEPFAQITERATLSVEPFVQEIEKGLSKEENKKKVSLRKKRHSMHFKRPQTTPESGVPVHEKDSDCYTFNLTDSSERKECTPGSIYIIRCRQCICPYMGNINYYCRDLPRGKYCEQAFPNFNYLPMGRRSNESAVLKATEIVPDFGPVPHNHTRYRCSKPGRILDECFICNCENDVVIEEHCFHSDEDKCKHAKPTFLDEVNKVVVVP